MSKRALLFEIEGSWKTIMLNNQDATAAIKLFDGATEVSREWVDGQMLAYTTGPVNVKLVTSDVITEQHFLELKEAARLKKEAAEAPQSDPEAA
jgi:hypothetical protein